ncbi:hypothetical protein VPH35_091820 [Triticum aestivum]
MHCPDPSLPSIYPWLAQHKLHLICKQHHTLQHTFRLSEPSDSTMIHPKKLAQLAKKCQRMLAAGTGARHRQHASDMVDDDCCSTASSVVADEGHCMVYSTDGARFEVPLAYLGTTVFAKLLRMSEEEFGFASGSDGGRITLPCDTMVMEYVLCLIRRETSEEVERAFLSSIAEHCHNYSASCVAPSMGLSHQFALCT